MGYRLDMRINENTINMTLDFLDTKPEPQNDQNRNFDKYQDNIQEKRKISQIPK